MFDAHPSNSLKMHETEHLPWQVALATANHASTSEQFDQAALLYTQARILAEQYGADSDPALAVQHALVDHYARQRTHLQPGYGGSPAVAALHRAVCCKECAVGEQLLSALARRFGQMQHDRAALLLRFAALYWDEINELRAFPLMAEALAIREHLFGPLHPDTIGIAARLAHWHEAFVEFDAAIPLLERILAYLEHPQQTNLPNRNEETLRTLLRLGNAYQAVSRQLDQEPIWRRALTIVGEADELALPAEFLASCRLEALYGVGLACHEQGRWQAADDLLRKAVNIHRQNPEHYFFKCSGISTFGLREGLQSYARTLHTLGRPGEALSLLEEALRLYHREDRGSVGLLRDYAAVLHTLGRITEARDAEQHATALEQLLNQRGRRYRAHKEL